MIQIEIIKQKFVGIFSITSLIVEFNDLFVGHFLMIGHDAIISIIARKKIRLPIFYRTSCNDYSMCIDAIFWLISDRSNFFFYITNADCFPFQYVIANTFKCSRIDISNKKRPKVLGTQPLLM